MSILKDCIDNSELVMGDHGLIKLYGKKHLSRCLDSAKRIQENYPQLINSVESHALGRGSMWEFIDFDSLIADLGEIDEDEIEAMAERASGFVKIYRL